MADNVRISPSRNMNAVEVATDEIGNIHYPVYKTAYGADGSVTQVDADNPLPVINTPDLIFSTTANLANGATYDSGVLSIENYSQLQTDIASDVDGTLTINFCSDNAPNIVRTLTIPYTGTNNNGTYQMFSAPAFTPFVQYKFTANEAGQSDFWFATKATNTAISPQILGVDAFISPLMVSNLNRSVLVAKSIEGNYQNLTINEIAGNRGLFDEQITTERTPLIELNSALGLSDLRDKITVVNGTVTNTGGEHVLSTGTATASSAELKSVEHGRYYPGTAAQVGMGIRVPDTYTGTANAEWGYFGASDGFGFGVDVTGTYIFYTRAGSQTKEYQTSWNVDVMDGAGISGATLNLANGNVYQINFSWYGYGVIEWYIMADGVNGRQVPVLVHKYRPTTTNSIRNPNQPITAKVDNGDTTTDYIVYMGGRQFSVYGRYIPSFRRTQESKIELLNVGTTVVPLISFRRKAGFESHPVKFHEINIISSANLLWELRVSPATLTTPSWGGISNIPATETALEVDVASTAITGGQKLESGLVATGGTGVNQSGGASNDSFAIEIPGTEIVTLCARALTGTATVTAVLGMEEEW